MHASPRKTYIFKSLWQSRIIPCELKRGHITFNLRYYDDFRIKALKAKDDGKCLKSPTLKISTTIQYTLYSAFLTYLRSTVKELFLIKERIC